MGDNCDFRPIWPIISETERGPWITNTTSQPIDPCWFQRPNGDLEREDARGSNFPAALRNYARTAGSKTTASEKVTHVGRFLFLGDQPPSIPRRRGSASPTFFSGRPVYVHTV